MLHSMRKTVKILRRNVLRKYDFKKVTKLLSRNSVPSSLSFTSQASHGPLEFILLSCVNSGQFLDQKTKSLQECAGWHVQFVALTADFIPQGMKLGTIVRWDQNCTWIYQKPWQIIPIVEALHTYRVLELVHVVTSPDVWMHYLLYPCKRSAK